MEIPFRTYSRPNISLLTGAGLGARVRPTPARASDVEVHVRGRRPEANAGADDVLDAVVY